MLCKLQHLLNLHHFTVKKRFKVLLNAASNRSKKRISMYFHVKATRTNKGGEGIVSVNQTFYVMLDETLDSGVSQI